MCVPVRIRRGIVWNRPGDPGGQLLSLPPSICPEAGILVPEVTEVPEDIGKGWDIDVVEIQAVKTVFRTFDTAILVASEIGYVDELVPRNRGDILRERISVDERLDRSPALCFRAMIDGANA